MKSPRHGRPGNALLVRGTPETARLDPLWGQGNPMYLWAEQGLVCCEDGRTNGFRTISWVDAARRVHALSQMIINSSEDHRWRKERIATQRFVIAMENVIRKAREQGAPYDSGQSLQSVIRQRERKVVPQKCHVISGDVF
jgi:hypothetical protein